MEPLHVRWRLDASKQAVHETRCALAAVLAAWRVNESARQDTLLVFAELATNALLHGKEPFAAHVTLGDEELTVDVTDGDYRIGTVQPRRLRGGDSETGRGLLLVAALTDQWGVYPTPKGKGIWATIPAQASLGTPPRYSPLPHAPTPGPRGARTPPRQHAAPPPERAQEDGHARRAASVARPVPTRGLT